MKFKYQELAGKFLPIVPIELKGKEWISYDAYVDSGASYSLFHADTAKDLNIKLESGKEDYISMADRSKIKIYLHKIKVKIATEEFTATIGFSTQLGIGFNIIGRLDIFNKFKICFDEKESFIDIAKGTLRAIIKQAGLTREGFMDLL